MAPMPNAKRIALVVTLLTMASVGIGFFLSERPRSVRHSWVVVAAILGMLVTVSAGLWARQKNRLSLALVLLLGGNILCSGAVLLPMSDDGVSRALDGAFLLW